MKTLKILTSVILLTAYLSVSAQDQQIKNVKRISINDIYIRMGSFIESNNDGSLTDFKILAQQSILLNDDFSQNNISSKLGISGSPVFSIMLGIKFSDKQKTTYKSNPLLRLGLSYFSGPNLSKTISVNNHNAYDTLTSSQTGQSIYIDSVTSKDYFMKYSSDQIRFDGSLIFRSNAESRLSLFIGLGFTAGFSFNANTDIKYSKYEYIETPYSNTNQYNLHSTYSDTKIINENFINKTNIGGSVYVPMGIDFRIGRKSGFWKQIHLFYEIRTGINFTSIPELRTIKYANLQYGLGMRYSMN